MTLFSVAQACRCLGIDAKTLHRWLTDAQLPLHPHPQDARKQAITQAQLEQLAQLHQRSLPFSSSPPPLPSEPLLASTLTERLDALQAHILVLQQQVADLTLLLRQPPHPPTSQHASAQPSNKTRQPPKRPAPSPKQPAKPVHVIARVEYSLLGQYVVICPKSGVLPLKPDTPEWFAWVKKQSSFRFVGKEGHFTAHHEWTTPRGAWRAHRQIRNHSYNVCLAPNQHLTIAVLEQAAHALQAHLA